jgi:phage shock protein A
MEAKANKLFDSAMAEAELNEGNASDKDLLGKYSSGCASSVEDEIAKMKASMGI